MKIIEIKPVDTTVFCNKLRGRSGHRIVPTPGGLLSIGGYNPHGEEKLLREVCYFNYSTHQWTFFKSCLPSEVASQCVLSHGGNILIFGGSGLPFGQSSSNALGKLSVAIADADGGGVGDQRTGAETTKRRWKLTYSACPPFPAPEASTDGSTNSDSLGHDDGHADRLEQPTGCYGAAMVQTASNQFHLFGGTSGRVFFDRVYRLDYSNPSQIRWYRVFAASSSTTESGLGRYRHEMIFYGEKLMVFGGGFDDRSCGLDLLPSFDIHARAWTDTATQPDPVLNAWPEARRSFALTQIDDDVIISGGCVSDQSEPFDDVWRLNLPEMRWHFLGTLPRTLCFHDSCHTPFLDRLLLFGGTLGWTDATERYRSNALYELSWRVGRLESLAWECVCSVLRKHRRCVSRDALSAIGIPHYLIECVFEFHSHDSISFG